MGRWAQRKRRGGARQFGVMSPPTAAMWSVDTPSTDGFQIHVPTPWPPPATAWEFTAYPASGIGNRASIVESGIGATVTGLSAGTQYDVQIRWVSVTSPFPALSEWSAVKTITTLT